MAPNTSIMDGVGSTFSAEGIFSRCSEAVWPTDATALLLVKAFVIDILVHGQYGAFSFLQ